MNLKIGLICPCLIAAAMMTTTSATEAATVDYAESRHAAAWLRHPVYGDPSFDSFERLPGNPIHRGAPPYEWPVNGFLFEDPATGNRYVYVGEYGKGYLEPSSRCVLYRSADRGETWTNLGVVLRGDACMFDRGGHTPDVRLNTLASTADQRPTVFVDGEIRVVMNHPPHCFIVDAILEKIY